MKPPTTSGWWRKEGDRVLFGGHHQSESILSVIVQFVQHNKQSKQ
jgi:hypothetical protein